MRILVVHNRYQNSGGEDSVVDDEIDLLTSQRHEVLRYERSNSDIGTSINASAAAASNLWSLRSASEIDRILRDRRPDLIHVHNTMPLVSPSVLWAAWRRRIPVVQTLHNVRSMCLNGLFLRELRVCEECKGRIPWRGVVHKCYRNSYGASAALGFSNVVHQVIGTPAKVSRYIALSEFSRRLFEQGGFPADRIVVKPNFSRDHGMAMRSRTGLLFVGRLSEEKGALVLLSVLKADPYLASNTRVIGEGPFLEEFRAVLPPEAVMGLRSRAEVLESMRSARAVVVPSICFENFPKVIVEAFSVGTPVVASQIGALAEIVVHNRLGLFAEPGNVTSLASAMRQLLSDPVASAAMGNEARNEFLEKYSQEVNYQRLIEIYESARATDQVS